MELELPEWCERLRPHQEEAIERIVEEFKTKDVVVLDAPTGTGKTLIAEGVRQRLGVAGCYVCTTKSLQEQVGRDFVEGRVLKGRSNYLPTSIQADPSITCADCDKGEEDDSCSLCPSVFKCAYEVAKKEALRSVLPILNTSYLLTEANGPGSFSGRRFVVADEADLLESELMRYVGVEISKRRVEQFRLGTPKKVTVKESWEEWISEAISATGKIKGMFSGSGIKVQREKKYWSGVHSKLVAVQKGMEEGKWVYTGDRERVAFKPVVVDSLGERLLWRHGEKWLLMSGTVISSGQLLSELGWRKGYGEVKIPSVFKASNRKVVVRPVSNMSRKGGKDGPIPERERLYRELGRIIKQHGGDRVLIHTVSYQLANDIVADVGSGEGYTGERLVVSYTESGNREEAIRAFVETNGAVLVAPSLDRGIDLPGDLCRVQIIAKVPYPNLGDKQVSARLYGPGGQSWYNVQTVRTVMQMCGRAVRGEEDWAVTYILDSQFGVLWGKGRGLFPQYFREAMVWERV